MAAIVWRYFSAVPAGRAVVVARWPMATSVTADAMLGDDRKAARLVAVGQLLGVRLVKLAQLGLQHGQVLRVDSDAGLLAVGQDADERQLEVAERIGLADRSRRPVHADP